MSANGKFESHFTFECADQSQLDSLSKQAPKFGLKFTHIVLDRGKSASQPMLTRHTEGILETEIFEAKQLSTQLYAEGFHISRIKMEVAANSDLAPHVPNDPRLQSEDGYFEHHIKLRLAPEDNLAELRKLAVDHNAHLSRNAFKDDHNSHERFVTQRCFHKTTADAAIELERLLHAVRPLALTILEIEQEYVVFDDNYLLDDGWID